MGGIDMVKEDYVSFEIAKLLKEKGFNEICLRTYYDDGDMSRIYDENEGVFNGNLLPSIIACPTHQMAMKWLREVHNIFISIDIYSKDLEGNIRYCVDIYKYGSRMILDTPIICNTYEETCESAIKYVLENLI